MNLRVIILFLIIVVTGCSAPNMKLYSQYLNEYEFKKDKKVFIETPKNASEFESQLYKVFIETLAEDGFVVVDDKILAEIILEYRYFDSLNNDKYGTTKKSFGISNTVYEKPVYGELGGKWVIRIKGYSRLMISLFDPLRPERSWPPWIWDSSVIAPSNKIENNPRIAIRLLLSNYGQKVDSSGVFPSEIN